MVATLNNTLAAREAYEQQIQYICGRLTLTTADASIRIGRVPVGCIIVGVHTRTVTAFSGGTPAVGVGTTAALVGSTGNLVASIAVGAGGVLSQPSVTIAQPLAADTDVFYGSSGGCTAGDGICTVWFIKPLS